MMPNAERSAPHSRPDDVTVKPVTIALSGGGAHAAAHAGVLRALEQAGVPVAGIAGVSGGALVAAAWAGGAEEYPSEGYDG